MDGDGRTCELGTLRLKFVSLVPADAMDDDTESGGRLAGLARDNGIDMVRRRLAAVKDRLGTLVRRRHDLRAHVQKGQRKLVHGKEVGVNETHVDIWSVDREGAFVLPDNHRHLSVNGVFLQQQRTGFKNISITGKPKKKSSETAADLVGGREVLRGIIVQVWHVGHTLEDRGYLKERQQRQQVSKSYFVLSAWAKEEGRGRTVRIG